MNNFVPLLASEYRKLLLLQKRYWLFWAIPIGLTFFVNSMIFFSFIIMFYMLLTLTESMDEKYGGQFFLGALPVERKTIVACKYTAAVLNLVAASLILVGVSALSSLILHQENSGMPPHLLFPVIFFIGLVYIILSLPIAICFGYSKGRMANLAIYVLLLVGSNTLWEMINGPQIMVLLTEKIWLVPVVIVAVLAVSYLIAQWSYQKRQYYH